MASSLTRTLWLLAGAGLWLACNPKLTGAPCTQDRECPKEQRCAADGKCDLAANLPPADGGGGGGSGGAGGGGGSGGGGAGTSARVSVQGGAARLTGGPYTMDVQLGGSRGERPASGGGQTLETAAPIKP